MVESIKLRTVCPNCKYTYEDDYKGKLTTTKCPNCFNIFALDGNGKGREVGFHYKKYKNVVGFAQTKNGREVAIDEKGRRIDPEETRYDLKKDQHGWKKTGKKVKGFKRE